MADLKCLCYRLMLVLSNMQMSVVSEHETSPRRGFQNTTRSGTRSTMNGEFASVNEFKSKLFVSESILLEPATSQIASVNRENGSFRSSYRRDGSSERRQCRRIS
jgi:hypothetical protein